MNMKRARLAAFLCALSAPALSAAADPMPETAMPRPLDLTIPRDILKDEHNPRQALSEKALPLPDLGGTRAGIAESARRGGGRWGDLPYGAGYEARQGAAGHGRGGRRGR